MTLTVFWMTFSLWWKKVWVFMKSYGSWILLGLSVVLTLIIAKNKQDEVAGLLKQQQDLSTRSHAEVAALEAAHEDELRRHAAIEAQYQETINRINLNHQAAIDQLTRVKQAELRQIIIDTQDKPDLMAQRINALFGLPIYTIPTTP